MRTVWVLGALAACAHSAQVYLSPFANVPSSPNRPMLSASEANALTALHLGLDHFQEGLVSLTGLVSAYNPFQKPQGALLVLVQTSGNIQDYIPPSATQQLAFQADPSITVAQWNELLSLYLHKLSLFFQVGMHDLGASITPALQRSGLDGILETAWDYIKQPFSDQESEIKLPVEPKQDYARFLTQLDLADASAKALLREFQAMDQLVEAQESQAPARLASLKLTGLDDIRQVHGAGSKQFKEASVLFKQVLEATLASFQQQNPSAKLVVVAAQAPSFAKRSLASHDDLLAAFHALPKRQVYDAPNGSVPLVPSSRKSYTSIDACNNATDYCSGRGACRNGVQAGKQVFVCSCAKINGTQFTGDTCTKQDVASDFFLIVGSVLLLLIVAFASVYTLVNAGSEELPQVLELTGGHQKHA